MLKVLYICLVQLIATMCFASDCETKLVYDGLSKETAWLYNTGKIEKGVFKIKAGKPMQWIASTSAGIENGKEYLVEFKVKIGGEFSTSRRFECAVRPEKSIYDAAGVTLYGGNPDFQNVSLRFNTFKHRQPYKLIFCASGEAEIEIKDVKVYEAKFTKFYPATKDAKLYAGKLENLPTGAKDFEIDAPRPTNDIVVNAEEFGLSEASENNAQALIKAIEHCKKVGASKLVVNNGVYKCFGDYEILFKDMKDFTFDGGGSTFIFRKKAILPNMNVVDCTRCKFRNFNMDWDWKNDPLAAVVKIEKSEKNPDGGSFVDVRFVEYKKYPLYKKPTRVCQLSPYDIQAQSVGVEDGWEEGYGYMPDDKGADVEWLEPNLLRIRQPWDFLPPVGSHYRLQHFYYGGRGMTFWSNSHLTLENINIYSCRGAAFYVYGNQHHWQMRNVNIKVRKLRKRPITCTADHLFFASSGGYFKMIGCEFSRGADDCLNIHDPCNYARKNGKKTVFMQNFVNKEFYKKGEKIEFRDATFAPVGFVGTVKSSKSFPNSRCGEVEFEEDLPAQKTDGFVLFNRAYRSQNVIIKDCYFHSNRARGILILTKDVTIENCRFRRNEMGAIKFETGYTLHTWCEGQGVENVVVRRCKFDTSNPFGRMNDGYERDIFVGVYIKRDPSTEQTSYPILNNILFENNRFKDSFGLVAFVASTGNFIFKDNVFENPTPRIFNLPYRGQIYIQNSSNAKIINNTYVASPNVSEAGVVVDASAKDTVVSGNRIVESASQIK